MSLFYFEKPQHKNARNTKEVVCTKCRRVFWKSRNKAEKVKNHFCCLNCRKVYRRNFPETINCLFCHKVFKPLFSRTKFCSHICSSNYTLGKKHSKKWCSNIAKSKLEEKNPMWKGDKVGYDALHGWLHRKLGKANICEFCGRKKTTPHSVQWANKSHLYKRDLNDWLQLCSFCHRKYDREYRKSCEMYEKRV